MKFISHEFFGGINRIKIRCRLCAKSAFSDVDSHILMKDTSSVQSSKVEKGKIQSLKEKEMVFFFLFLFLILLDLMVVEYCKKLKIFENLFLLKGNLPEDFSKIPEIKNLYL